VRRRFHVNDLTAFVGGEGGSARDKDVVVAPGTRNFFPGGGAVYRQFFLTGGATETNVGHGILKGSLGH